MRAAIVLIVVLVVGFGLWAVSRGGSEHIASRGEGARGQGTSSKTSPSVPAAPKDLSNQKTDVARRWEVILLGPADRPLKGIPVRGYPEKKDYTTDAAGRAVLPGPAKARQRLMACPFEPHGRILTAPRTVIRFPKLLPLELRTVDGVTGKRLDGIELVVGTLGGDLAPEKGVIMNSPFGRGGHDRVTVHIKTPGWTTRDGLRYRLDEFIGSQARRVTATIPLYRELDWRIELPHGYALHEIGMMRGPDKLAHEIETGARRGVVRVRGVPFLPGTEAYVVVRKDKQHYIAYHRITTLAAMMLLDPEEDATEQPFTMPPKNSITVRYRPDIKNAGAIRASVRRSNGAPARGVRVQVAGREFAGLAHTDARGIATVSKMEPGTYEIYAGAAGFVPTRARVTVTAGKTSEVVLTEPAGWTLQLRVRDDENDQPLPFLRVTVTHETTKMPYALLRDGVQYVPILTGADGTLVLPNLGPEPIAVGARQTVRVTPDHEGILELRVPR